MFATILNALPLYGLSLLYLLYWLDPSRQLFLSITQLGQLLTIEGPLLFFSFVTIGLIRRGEFRRNIVALVLVLFFAFVVSFAFRADDRVLFWLLLGCHLFGSINSTDIDRSRTMLVLFASVPILILTGVLAYRLQIPMFAERYPAGIKTAAFSNYLAGHAMLAWGSFYFGIVATLHLLSSLIRYPKGWKH